MGTSSTTGKPPAVQASGKAGNGDRLRKSRRRLADGTLAQHPPAGRAQKAQESLKYAVVFERTPRNYGAYVPDLPGCVATGKTLAAVKRRIREAIAFHIEGLKLEGVEVPEPSASVDLVEVA